MNRGLIYFLTTLFVLNVFSCNGQDTNVYEIPFSIHKRLLVFKGKLNGVETDFAFDTGAAEGIATTKDEKRNAVKRTNGLQQISDGNGKVTQLQTVFSKELSIGGFTFSNVRASINDMPFLYCTDLYLLGADIIRKLNWEIDFKNMVLKVSKNSFTPNENMAVIPVTYNYNTPRTQITLNGITCKNVLIDFGYTGSMTIPNSSKKIQHLLENKRKLGLVTAQITSAFAAGGMSKPALSEIISIDSLTINNYQYKEIEGDFKANTDYKIGLGFFVSTCDKVIINNNQKKYFLQLKRKNNFIGKFPISVLLIDYKLKISLVTVSDSILNKTFTISEEIKSINEKTASDFITECDFLTWLFLIKRDKYTIKKNNGEIVEVQKSPNR